jgi:4-(2-carboxyphenyl)-2-oxobut-3-enoate aldolase
VTRNTRNAVNVDETARAVDALIRDGVSAFCLNGTFGEAPSLTAEEQRTYTATVVEAARDRVPVFGGATTLNTRDTLDRARVAKDVGAKGLMLGRPMMSPLSDENIVNFYRDIAEELPDMAIFLYDDQEAFKRPITTKAYAQLAKIPQIIGCKYRSRLMISGLVDNCYNTDLEAVGDNIKLMVSEVDWQTVARLYGVDACWSSGVNGGPAPIMALRDALAAQDWATANEITHDMSWCYEGLIPPAGFEVWHIDKIPFMKARFAAAGYLKPGPALPPYYYISEERLAVARECGRRSQEMQKKYSRPHATQKKTLAGVY